MNKLREGPVKRKDMEKRTTLQEIYLIPKKGI